MKKPFWLKSSYVRSRISQQIVRWLKPKTRDLATRNVLIFSTDGLGDAILRLSTVKALIEKHGTNLVWVLTRSASESLYRKMGAKTILYTDQHRRSFLKRFELVRTLQDFRFDTIYVLDFHLNEDLVELIDAPKKIGFVRRDAKKVESQFTTPIPHPGYVGDALENFSSTVGISPRIMDNTDILFSTTENIKDHNSAKLEIAIGIGASNFSKMMRRSNLRQILYALSTNYPQARIRLLGFGVRDERYAELLFDKSQQTIRNIENNVSEYDLSELVQVVLKSNILIGFDSALYNLAFTLRIPTVCLSYGNTSVLHSKPWVRILHGSGVEWGTPDAYGCKETNSLVPEQVLDAVDDLLHQDQSDWDPEHPEELTKKQLKTGH